jgi:hypothetical protein
MNTYIYTAAERRRLLLYTSLALDALLPSAIACTTPHSVARTARLRAAERTLHRAVANSDGVVDAAANRGAGAALGTCRQHSPAAQRERVTKKRSEAGAKSVMSGAHLEYEVVVVVARPGMRRSRANLRERWILGAPPSANAAPSIDQRCTRREPRVRSVAESRIACAIASQRRIQPMRSWSSDGRARRDVPSHRKPCAERTAFQRRFADTGTATQAAARARSKIRLDRTIPTISENAVLAHELGKVAHWPMRRQCQLA